MLYVKIQMDNIRPERYFVYTSMEINPKLDTFVGKSWGRGIILTGRELECRMVGRTKEAVVGLHIAYSCNLLLISPFSDAATTTFQPRSADQTDQSYYVLSF